MLIYAGSEFMTSDAIADAVLRYSAALAEGRNAATIDVPIIGRDGTASSAAFLLGPASQIVSRDFETDIAEPDDPELVERLEALTRELHPTAAIESEPMTPDVDWTWES